METIRRNHETAIAYEQVGLDLALQTVSCAQEGWARARYSLSSPWRWTKRR